MWVPDYTLNMIRRLTDGLAWALKKGVASCDTLRVGACDLRSGDARMGFSPRVIPAALRKERKPSERKHPSRRRKRDQLEVP